jgi:hypothetical protein
MSKAICATRQFELPQLKVAPYIKNTKIWVTDGTNDQDAEFASARCISTYPTLPNKKRDGDPIADKLFCGITTNRVVVAMADGCNWGSRPEQAAIKATTAVKNYLQDRQEHIRDLSDLGHYLYRSFCVAHNSIIEGNDYIWDAGTTTLLSGMCVELEPEKDTDPKWGFLCASVGDCKAFLFSQKSQKVIDITAGNRLNQKDARDPGGRLGPYLEHGNPDLRNLKLYYIGCEEGDIVSECDLERFYWRL